MSSTLRFNAVVFEEAVHRECADTVKGYAFVIATEEGFQAKVSGGWAQAPGDGRVPMKTYVSSCIGSVSKVYSAIALLHLFNERKLSNATVQSQLDINIWRKLPKKWQESFSGRNLEEITYRHLLQHKCFRVSDKEAKRNTTGNKISYVLSKGVSTSDLASRDYNNFNFTILLYLIPAIAYSSATESIHRKYNHLNVDEYSRRITPEYGELYEKYMNEKVFARAIQPISPTCRPKRTLPAQKYAKYYSNRNDESGGVFDPDFCRSQGSWYTSAQELATFARTFAFTDRYIGPTTRASLYDPTDRTSRDNRIVYSRIIEHNEFERDLGQRHWAFHGGDQEGYQAALIKLPDDHYGIGMVNSNEISSGRIARILIDAFYDATRDRPISLAKHGLSEARYQQYTSELSEHGSFPDWIDFYAVGSQVSVNVIYRPAPGAWIARHGLNGREYQDLLDEYVMNGSYRLKQVDSYVQNGRVRYAAVLMRGGSTAQRAYHGLSAEEHQQRFEGWTSQGFAPVNVCVTSIDGQRNYVAFYEKRNVGGLVSRSALTAAQYQSFVDEQLDAKREIAHLSQYVHKRKVYYSAIFYGNVDRAQVLRHNLSANAFQREFDKWTGQGYALKMVTAATTGTSPVFAAVWERSS